MTINQLKNSVKHSKRTFIKITPEQAKYVKGGVVFGEYNSDNVDYSDNVSAFGRIDPNKIAAIKARQIRQAQ